MIPQDYITAWSRVAPWASQRQVEQDLIISRALVAIFSDPFLRGELRFRGGTALNKLHFPAPLRYSEDIDLVRTTAGPIRPLLDRLHDVLDPWLGKPRFDQSPVAPKLKYTVEAEDRDSPSPIRLKIEINTREREAYDPPIEIPFGVENPWFAGEAAIPTFSREEMLATKLRALLQRNKGRDLFDLDHALTVFEGLNTARIVECFRLYLERSEVTISRAEAQQRMFQKLVNPTFFTDMRPLLQTDRAKALNDETLKATFVRVMNELIDLIPGDEWAKAGEMRERFGVLAILERLLSLRGPERPCVFTLLALELIGHPEQRAVDHGAIIAGQVHDPGLDDEAAEFDQMPRALAAFDLPGAHVMTRPRCLMPVARRPVAPKRRLRRGQAPIADRRGRP